MKNISLHDNWDERNVLCDQTGASTKRSALIKVLLTIAGVSVALLIPFVERLLERKDEFEFTTSTHTLIAVLLLSLMLAAFVAFSPHCMTRPSTSLRSIRDWYNARESTSQVASTMMALDRRALLQQRPKPLPSNSPSAAGSLPKKSPHLPQSSQVQ